MKKLFRFLKPYRRQSVLSPLFKLIEVGFELAVPLVVASIIDRGIPSGDSGYVVKMCLLLAGFSAAGLLCAVSAQYFAAKAATGFSHDISRELFRHIQTLSSSQTDALGEASLITRLTSDVNLIQTGLNLTLRLLLRSPFVVFGAMIMAFTIDVKTAMLFVYSIPVLCAVIFFVMLVCIPLYRKIQVRLEGLLRLTRENLTGARVIRAFGAQNAESEKFSGENGELSAEMRRTGRISALLNPATAVIVNAAIILLLYTGALRVDSGELTTGEVVALYNYMAQILVELIKLADLIINVAKSLAAAGRVSAVLEIKPDMTCPDGGATPDTDAAAVEFKNVNMSYSGADDALTDISFTLPKGGRLGIIGGTGSGKSTLVNLIPRLYDAASGEVRVFGSGVKEYSEEELRSIVGIVPQNAELFSGTIRDNLTLGGVSATDAELYSALRTAQGQFVLDKDGGLDAELEQGGKNLSGGQRQRLTIARALARKPLILILDDSASALDAATDASLRRALRGLDVTLIIVSQRVSAMRGTDGIIVLDDGKLVGRGTEEELLGSCPVYREIYASQTRGEAAV